MANEQHLKLINEAIEKHDIAIWNKWRQENPDIRPDLSGADLRETDLNYADLSKSDLNKANLIRTHLSAANLTEANFSEANLDGANFSDALLLGALLFGADLNKANLEDNVKKLSQSQIRTAKNWETAYYCKGILEDFGLPLGHNETLRKGIEEKKAKE
jgi:hypothetical protein